jgi:hypothetical protein
MADAIALVELGVAPHALGGGLVADQKSADTMFAHFQVAFEARHLGPARGVELFGAHFAGRHFLLFFLLVFFVLALFV